MGARGAGAERWRCAGANSATGEIAQEVDLTVHGKGEPNEIRCVRRDLLLQALEEELPRGTIRYSSKIVSIEEDGAAKILQLADGSVLRAKVLIGCDGINSLVARSLGLAKPSYSGRVAMRGLAHFPDGHGFEPKFLQFIGRGFRSGMRPCNETDIYWFFTWTPSENDKGVPDSAGKMKQFVLANLRSLKVPAEALSVIERTEMNDVLAVPLRFRSPLPLITASICKGNVCVAGDALHPMTPDLAQGGCSALEDAVILARCLGENSPAFFYCEVDGTSLCLSCDMTVHVGGKRTHGRYLLLRQRVEFPGDKPGHMDDVAMQTKDPEDQRDQKKAPHSVTKEQMANHHNGPDDPASDGNCNDQRNIDSKMIDLNMQPVRTHGQGSNSQTQGADHSVNNHDSPGVVPSSNYERDADN